MASDSKPTGARFRVIDWVAVRDELSKLPPQTTVFIGELDQSVRTHLRKGRVKYINPDLYEIWTVHAKGKHKNRANLYMCRK
tara:strand:+ start:153 stop:398 length:246 start_codon:yes stop_codon:yes gene_type:complete